MCSPHLRNLAMSSPIWENNRHKIYYKLKGIIKIPGEGKIFERFNVVLPD